MNKTNIYIVGAGTYGPVIYELTEMLGFNVKSIYDDDEAKVGLRIINASVIGSLSLSKLNIKEKNFAVAIGNNFIRRRFCDNIEKLGGHLPTLIHPRAEKSPYAKIGKGCFIHAMTYIWTNVSVGDFCIISPKVIVSHDTNIESGCFVSYGANVGSGISIGENSFIGPGATIMTGVKRIGNNSIIGAGSTVIKDVDDNSVVVGVPGKKIKKNIIDI